MRQSSSEPEPPSGPDDPVVIDWLLSWVELGILIVLALVGAFVAADQRPGDYACGLTLSFASLALAMLRIKARFDGEPAAWTEFLLVSNWPSMILAIIVFFGIALVGVLVAAGLSGTFYSAGLALAGTSALAVFLSLKNVFDHENRR